MVEHGPSSTSYDVVYRIVAKLLYSLPYTVSLGCGTHKRLMGTDRRW